MTSANKWLILACLAIAPHFSYGADTTALTKRLHNTADASSLDDASLKPWHLKLAVQLYDAKGNPSEQGTIEEWWTPDASKRIYTTPSYKAIELYNNKLIYRTKGQPTVPYFLDAALRLVVHPMPPAETIDKADLGVQAKTFGGLKLDCILLTKPGTTFIHSAGQVLIECLDNGVDQLRASWLDPEVSTRNSIGLFQQRRVAVDSSISIYGAKAISEHVEELDAKVVDLSLFQPSNDLEERSEDPVWISADTTSNAAIHRVTPTYSEEAKRNHVSGVVMLIATIGTDGHVIETQIVGSPDPSLAKSAGAAVKQWAYSPYLRNGVGIKIRTTIAVHYRFGD